MKFKIALKLSIILLPSIIPASINAAVIIPPALVQPYAPLERRMSSDPHISGDSFRLIAHHTFDELRTPFDPDAVREGDIIFVNGYYFEYFYEHIHAFIKKPYKIICHNTDLSIPTEKTLCILDEPNVIGVFTQNPSCYHKKLIGLPIGLANKHWKHGNTDIINCAQGLDLPKVHLLYSNFLIRTYPAERSLVYELFKNKSFCYNAANKEPKNYLADIKDRKSVV